MGKDKGMQSFKKIYSVIMKLNRCFALHFFANDLYYCSTDCNNFGTGRKLDKLCKQYICFISVVNLILE